MHSGKVDAAAAAANASIPTSASGRLARKQPPNVLEPLRNVRRPPHASQSPTQESAMSALSSINYKAPSYLVTEVRPHFIMLVVYWIYQFLVDIVFRPNDQP